MQLLLHCPPSKLLDPGQRMCICLGVGTSGNSYVGDQMEEFHFLSVGSVPSPVGDPWVVSGLSHSRALHNHGENHYAEYFDHAFARWLCIVKIDAKLVTVWKMAGNLHERRERTYCGQLLSTREDRMGRGCKVTGR